MVSDEKFSIVWDDRASHPQNTKRHPLCPLRWILLLGGASSRRFCSRCSSCSDPRRRLKHLSTVGALVHKRHHAWERFTHSLYIAVRAQNSSALWTLTETQSSRLDVTRESTFSTGVLTLSLSCLFFFSLSSKQFSQERHDNISFMLNSSLAAVIRIAISLLKIGTKLFRFMVISPLVLSRHRPRRFC